MAERQLNWLGVLGLLMLRVMLGVVFVYHGCEKFGLFGGIGLQGFAQYLDSLKVPYPALAAVLAGGAELLGGAALITGYGVRTMAVPLATTMGVASYLAHQHVFSMTENGFEYPLTLGVATLAVGLMGPGRLSVEYYIEAGKSLLPSLPERKNAPRQKKYRTENFAAEA